MSIEMTPAEALKQVQALENAPVVPKETPPPAPPEPPKDTVNLLGKILKGDLAFEDIPDGLYKAFLRNAVGNAPFMHTFTLFNGLVDVTFKEVDVKQIREYNNILDGLPKDNDELRMQFIMLNYIYKIISRDPEKKGAASVLYERSDDMLKGFTAKQPIGEQIIALFDDKFENIGGSLRRTLPELWLIFSGVWSFLIHHEIPQTF